MHIEILKQIDELPKIKGAWQTLCDVLKDSITPFSSFEWYEIWWKHYSAGESPLVIAIWDAEKLVGIAPLMLRRATIHGLPVTAVCFIENNQSFLNDFIVLPAFRERFLQQLMRLLFEQRGSAGWDAIFLNKLSTSSANYQALVKILNDTGRKWQEEQTIDARHIIPSGSWADFLSSRSTRTRKTLRNIQNSIQKAGAVSVRHIRTLEEFQEVWGEVSRVARGSWTENIGDSMASPANESFFNDLARCAAAKGWLSLWTLCLDGKTIAIEFHLRAHGKEYAMRGHYLPEYGNLSPGTFLEMQVLKDVFEESDRLQKYDLGNFYSYKRKWSDNSEPHMAVSVFNNRLYSRFVSFHEMKTVPALRRIIPQSFWEHKIFEVCGIKTRPFDLKQH